MGRFNSQDDWHSRPPVVVVCPRCESGIYQHRHNYTLECPDCSFRDPNPHITEYEIIRFDCPDCGGDIAEFATRNLAGGDAPDFVTHVDCPDCEMSWEAPHH